MRYLIVLLVLNVCMIAQTKKLTVKVHPKTQQSGPSVSLSCTPGVPNGQQGAAQSYNFYRGTISGGPYTLLGTSPMESSCAYEDVTVQQNVTYYYVATALDIPVGGTCPTGQTCESGYSNQATAVIPPQAPPAPTGLTVVSIQAGKVELQWNPPGVQAGVTVEKYKILRGFSPSMPNPAVIATTPNTRYTDTMCKSTCYYEIEAIDEINNKLVTTGPSNVVKAVV